MAEGLRDRLMGALRLAEFSVTARDGSVTHPMGKDLEGLIIYSPDGYMSEDLAAAAAGYLAHSGPFYVDTPRLIWRRATPNRG
jgi:hypothetical protein